MLERMTPVVKNLLIINVLIFISQIALIQGFSISGFPDYYDFLKRRVPGPDEREFLQNNLFLGRNLFNVGFKPWQIISHMFMHGSLTHLFFNMLPLVIFGTTLERVWGSKRFLQYYILCGIGAFFIYSLFAPNPVLGASGAVFGLLLAFGMLFPNTELMLLFPPIPIKAKYFVILYGLLELSMAMSNNQGDNVAHVAHLGGMVIGYILIKKWQNSRDVFY